MITLLYTILHILRSQFFVFDNCGLDYVKFNAKNLVYCDQVMRDFELIND